MIKMVSVAAAVVKWEQEAGIPVHSNILQCENRDHFMLGGTDGKQISSLALLKSQLYF